MLIITVVVLQLRHLFHPDVLHRLIKSHKNDLLHSLLHSSLKKQTKRLVVSFIIYNMLIYLMIFLPVKFVQSVQPCLLRIDHMYTNSSLYQYFIWPLLPILPLQPLLSYSPRFVGVHLPIDLITFHLLVLFTLEHARAVFITPILRRWLWMTCNYFGLVEYLLPVLRDNDDGGGYELELKPGARATNRATNDAERMTLLARLKPRQTPPFCFLRIFGLLFFAYWSILFSMLILGVTPYLLGRLLMHVLLVSDWAKHDPYYIYISVLLLLRYLKFNLNNLNKNSCERYSKQCGYLADDELQRIRLKYQLPQVVRVGLGSPRVVLCVQDRFDGDVMFFSVKTTTEMSKVIEEYANLKKIPSFLIHFEHDDYFVGPDDSSQTIPFLIGECPTLMAIVAKKGLPCKGEHQRPNQPALGLNLEKVKEELFKEEKTIQKKTQSTDINENQNRCDGDEQDALVMNNSVKNSFFKKIKNKNKHLSQHIKQIMFFILALACVYILIPLAAGSVYFGVQYPIVVPQYFFDELFLLLNKNGDSSINDNNTQQRDIFLVNEYWNKVNNVNFVIKLFSTWFVGMFLAYVWYCRVRVNKYGQVWFYIPWVGMVQVRQENSISPTFILWAKDLPTYLELPLFFC